MSSEAVPRKLGRNNTFPPSDQYHRRARLRGRVGKFYGITTLYRNDPKPFREDLPKIFRVACEKEVRDLNRVFPLLEAKQALELLATGSAEGKIVLSVDAS